MKTDRGVYLQAALRPPQLGEIFDDPIFGSSLKRITQAESLVDNAWGDGRMVGAASVEYGTIRSANAGGTRMALLHGSYFALYDGAGKYLQDLRPGGFIAASMEPRWSVTDPNLLYYLDGRKVKICDVRTMTATVRHEFTQFVEREDSGRGGVQGMGEGDLSEDGRFWALAGLRPSGEREIFLFDLQNGTGVESSLVLPADSAAALRAHSSVVSRPGTPPFPKPGTLAGAVLPMDVYLARFARDLPMKTGRAHGFDNIYVTPDNNVLVGWYEAGTGRFQGVELYDRQMNFLHQVVPVMGHQDVCRDQNGDECLVWADAADSNGACGPGVVKVRLGDTSSKQECVLKLDWNQALHVFGPAQRGRALISTFTPDASAPWTAFTNEILELGLDGKDVNRLAHHRSQVRTYEDSPKANGWGKILFNSNWNGTLNVYMMDRAVSAVDPPIDPPVVPVGDGWYEVDLKGSAGREWLFKVLDAQGTLGMFDEVDLPQYRTKGWLPIDFSKAPYVEGEEFLFRVVNGKLKQFRKKKSEAAHDLFGSGRDNV